MKHLTLAGLWAGRPFCGVSRVEAAASGDEFFHPNVRLLEQPLYRENICSKCLSLWDDPEQSNNPGQGSPLVGVASGHN